MKKRLVLLVASGLLLAGLAWWVLAPTEPSYEGKSLSNWLTSQGNMGPSDEFTRAMKHMGSKALPRLLGLLQVTESPWEHKMREWASRYSPISIVGPSADDQHLWALTGFDALGDAAAAGVPALTNLLKHQDVDVRASAALALGKIGLSARPAVGALKDSLKDPHPYVRGCTVQSLAQVSREPEILSLLLTSGADPDKRVYGAALDALVTLGPRARPALPTLVQMMEGRDTLYRQVTLSVLMRLDPDAALPVLTNSLKDPATRVRCLAISLLSSFTNRTSVIVPLLADNLQEKDPYVATAAARALYLKGPEARTATPALLKILEERDHPAWLPAAQALLKIDPEAAARAGIKESDFAPTGRRAGRR